MSHPTFLCFIHFIIWFSLGQQSRHRLVVSVDTRRRNGAPACRCANDYLHAGVQVITRMQVRKNIAGLRDVEERLNL
jgi:hypothetical protein